VGHREPVAARVDRAVVRVCVCRAVQLGASSRPSAVAAAAVLLVLVLVLVLLVLVLVLLVLPRQKRRRTRHRQLRHPVHSML